MSHFVVSATYQPAGLGGHLRREVQGFLGFLGSASEYIRAIFLLVGLWTLVYGLIYRPVESAAGFATVFSGLIVYGLGRKAK